MSYNLKEIERFNLHFGSLKLLCCLLCGPDCRWCGKYYKHRSRIQLVLFKLCNCFHKWCIPLCHKLCLIDYHDKLGRVSWFDSREVLLICLSAQAHLVLTAYLLPHHLKLMLWRCLSASVVKEFLSVTKFLYELLLLTASPSVEHYELVTRLFIELLKFL